MTRVTPGFAEQSEELGLGQLGLSEHLVNKADAPQDHPELAVGGRRHLCFEEAARSCWRGIDAESPDVAGVGRAIGALAEPIELGHILLGVIEGHVDQPLERVFGTIGFGRKVELRTQRDSASDNSTTPISFKKAK